MKKLSWGDFVPKSLPKRSILPQVLNKFYASGFLYHPKTTQILLQQEDSSEVGSFWSLLGGSGEGSETKGENFKRVAAQILKLNLSFSAIHSVYDYFHAGLRKINYVCYGEVEELSDFPPSGNSRFAWFTQSEIAKMKNVSEQTKQDVIVGQRVIDSTNRRISGERTIG